MGKKKMEIGGLPVKIDKDDFVSLTDIAKASDKPAYVIRRWLRNPKTIVFLQKWEEYFNPAVKVALYNHLLIRLTDESFHLSPSTLC